MLFFFPYSLICHSTHRTSSAIWNPFKVHRMNYPHQSIDNPGKQCFCMPELVKRKCKNPDAYLDEQDLKEVLLPI